MTVGEKSRFHSLTEFTAENGLLARFEAEEAAVTHLNVRPKPIGAELVCPDHRFDLAYQKKPIQ